jgi:hypothetical protein
MAHTSEACVGDFSQWSNARVLFFYLRMSPTQMLGLQVDLIPAGVLDRKAISLIPSAPNPQPRNYPTPWG